MSFNYEQPPGQGGMAFMFLLLTLAFALGVAMLAVNLIKAFIWQILY